MAERVAVVIAEGSFSGGSNVGKDQRRSCLGGNSLKVNAVPGWGGRGEDAWFGTELAISIVSYTKAITLGCQQVLAREAL